MPSSVILQDVDPSGAVAPVFASVALSVAQAVKSEELISLFVRASLSCSRPSLTHATPLYTWWFSRATLFPTVTSTPELFTIVAEDARACVMAVENVVGA